MASISPLLTASSGLDASTWDWLLHSPVLTAVSSLVIDAAGCGLIDLGESLATAVAVEARLRTLDLPPTTLRSPKDHPAPVWRRVPLRVRIEAGTAILAGSVGAGGVVRQSVTEAWLHVAVDLPETLVAALPGRPLRSLVSSPMLDRRDHLVTAAESMPTGVQVAFDLEAIPIELVRPALLPISRGPAAPPVPGRHRSR